jgi:hypothetical protein
VVAVIVALLIVVLGGSAAMTFDLARLRHERHLVQAAVDFGSLAGAAYLPVSDPPGAAIAEAAAREIAINNAPQLEDAGLTITFACVISDPEGDGPSGSFDFGFACGPNGGTGTWTNWIVRGGRAYHLCYPNAGDLCNTITLTASSSVDYYFAPLLGFETGDTGAVAASACKGYCGQSASPLDVVFIIDRSRSMSDADMENLRDAIADPSPAEDSILEFYDPNEVHIGLLALPYKVNGDECGMPDRTQIYPPPNSTIWDIAPIQGGYRSGSTLVLGNDLVQKVLCLKRPPPSFGSFNLTPSTGGHTDHGDPIARAQAMLASQGRPDAPDVIILFADGEANQPGNSDPCKYANDRATSAKSAGTTVFSLAYGAAGAECTIGVGTGRDRSGSPFYRKPATAFLAAVASPFPNGDPSTDDVPYGCGINENKDGDFYFCEGRGEDLQDVFKRIAIQSLQRSRLLNF